MADVATVPYNVQTVPNLVSGQLIVDLGNSGGRCWLTFMNRLYQFEISNHFAKIGDDLIDQKYVNKRSMLFLYDNERYVNGHVLNMEYSNEYLRPTSTQAKLEQEVSMVTLQAAINKAACIVLESGLVDLNYARLSFSLTVLLPPIEEHAGLQALKENLNKLTTVHLEIPFNMQIQVGLGVSTKPEGVCGFFSAFFKVVGLEPVQTLETNKELDLKKGDYYIYEYKNVSIEFRDENTKFVDQDVLVIDIGAGTSDLALARAMEIIEDSRDTQPYGGNVVETQLINTVKKNFNLRMTKQGAAYAVQTGLAKEGTGYHIVDDLVKEAKDNYAKRFLLSLQEYFEANMIEPRRLGGVLVVGGGGLPTLRQNSDGVLEEVVEPMVKYILDHLSKLAPKIIEVDTTGLDLRQMNLEGAFILLSQEALGVN